MELFLGMENLVGASFLFVCGFFLGGGTGFSLCLYLFSDVRLFIVLHGLSLVVGHRLLTVVVSLVLKHRPCGLQ